MKNDRIRENLGACLQEVRVSPALHRQILQHATAPAPARRTAAPRKLIVAAAVVLMLLMTTAAALTILEMVRQDMQPVKEFLVELVGHDRSWRLEDKMYYVDLMEKWGFDLDPEQLAQLRSGEGTEAERNLLAGRIIWDCIAAHRLAVHGEVIPDPANQPEPYPVPSSQWLFEMLWLQNDPQASLEEIHAAYEAWFTELHAALPADTPVPDNMTDAQKYAALLNEVDAYMADVMSMSGREREAAVITAELNEAGTAWQVVISVNSSDLREVTREWFHRAYLYGNAAYDKATDVYAYPYVFKAEGGTADTSTLEEYDWRVLVPSTAYPPMPDAYGDYPYFDPLKCFLYASAAEKAAFSQQYKPIVDAWLQEHPAYKARLDAEGGSDPLYRITRHRYGTPPQTYVQQDEALRIAVMHTITLRPDVTADQLMNRCHHIIYYDVCNPDAPLWKIELDWDAERALPDDPLITMLLVIDPETGDVIADQRTLTLEEALHW